MARDFLALQNECLQYGYGERERPFFKTWLNEASYDVAGRGRWRWLDFNASVTTTANQESVGLTTALVMFPERLRPYQASLVEPRYVAWDSYESDFHRESPTVNRGMPTVFSYNDDLLYFYPTPDAVYTYRIYGQSPPSEMTADSAVPWMPTEHRGVLVSGAMMKMAARDKDFNAVQYWSDQYEGQIAKMRTTNMLKHSGSPNKVPMPGSYWWGN